ncbi:TRAM domain-containing protein [Corynebacterium sp. ES2730-CONJ]|uniref:class I SAM-dependent RNA methyltransferase n=1 Tax=Corynebacterium sp. ES2730-CONJ TaxID=2973941 RepID=UPI00216AECDE|nr:TRAM domain-containing protein [Corynebacterium sp. ES2730-CONJ]MCS4531103.1 TRAM domain-containing protein [Corynebacterium sp. ES2730-CONJ]
MNFYPSSTEPKLSTGQRLELKISRVAHGGEGIAIFDGRVIFVQSSYPGDTVLAEVTKVKRNFARALLIDVLEPAPARVEQRCPAAALGAGCCDFGDLEPKSAVGLKTTILRDQLTRLGGLENLPDIQQLALNPYQGWRTRMRLGVDDQGRAGMRALRSNDVISAAPCAQAVPGLLDSVVGEEARRFTPHAEVIVVMDDDHNRHIVEISKAPRGRRSETITKVIEGSDHAIQKVAGYTFKIPATAFWQAHVAALETYSQQITSWLKNYGPKSHELLAWDLYGGVGALVPAIREGSNPQATIYSVETSPGSARAGRKAFDRGITFITNSVEAALGELPNPDIVVLDPPRTGAASGVIEGIAAAQPDIVIHIGCDPATFARDVRRFVDQGYIFSECVMIDAFPGTHHLESMGLFLRS